jgi:hypothetical protein
VVTVGKVVKIVRGLIAFYRLTKSAINTIENRMILTPFRSVFITMIHLIGESNRIDKRS